jgi:hypothetical protein
MELAELLEREGLDPDELMNWARGRADGLIAACDADDPLRGLLAAGVDVAERVSVGRRRVPSHPQPFSADELPPPPEQPRLADGEPEPILETFDTGAIQLGTPEADSLIAEHSSRPRDDDDDGEAEAEAEAEDAGELEELEFDELVELDDEELELLEELDDQAEPPPPPPPPPSEDEASPREGDTAVNIPTPVFQDDAAPVQTGDTAAHPALELDAPVQTGDTAASPALEPDAPVQTGDTAAHPALEPEAPSEADDDDDFDLDFDD